VSLHIACSGAVIVDGTHDSIDVNTLYNAIVEASTTATVPLRLELYGLDLDSGQAVVTWHEVVRRLRDRTGHLVLVDAPQMLAHSLYKVGDLTDGRIELVEPRMDDGITVN